MVALCGKQMPCELPLPRAGVPLIMVRDLLSIDDNAKGDQCIWLLCDTAPCWV